jgi:hypothetical protein
MANVNLTDVNDGTTYSVVKADVRGIYELTEYRIVRMNSGQEYDVTETFASLTQDVGGGSPGP